MIYLHLRPSTLSASFLLLVALAAAIGCSSETYLAATPHLYTAEGAADPFERVPELWRTNQVKILYATDRVAEASDDGRRTFGYGRSMALELGYVNVAMGDDLSWNELVAASRGGRRERDIVTKVTEVVPVDLFPDSNRPPVVVDGVAQEDPWLRKKNAEAEANIHKILGEFIAPAARKEVFLYVHGYNNTFDEAACRMAMLWHFMGREGVPAIYTWPAGSGGILRGYNYDRESGEFTIFHLKQFLRALATCPSIEKINIVAHSRGTDVTVTALRELHLECKGLPGSTRERLKLGHLVLAAPDLDWEVFNQRVMAERLGVIFERITVYVSKNDKAIGLSDWLFQSGQRLGNLMGSDVKSGWQESLKHLRSATVVDVKAKTDFLGHAYFVSSPDVLSDLILTLRDGRLPGAANGRPLVQREDGFWELRDGYPNAPQSAAQR